MKLATFTAPGIDEAASGIVEGDRVVRLGGPDGVRQVLAGEVEATPAGESWPLSEVTLLAPIPAPGTVYAIGMNYARHVAEMGAELPAAPLVFVKVGGSVSPPGGPVRCPGVVRRLDYEGELALVMGRGGAIAGYCIADDVSARDLQGRESQWTRAKGADTFCPFGPWVTTAEEIVNPEALRLRTWVNGELRQDSSTADLVFSCKALVDFISETNTLQPGDLILTGTPSGVGMAMDPPTYLQAGDRVKIAIEGLGEIEHPIA